MELNDMFALLIRTKVDAKTVIERAKEIFPDEALFDRYEDELATLFNEEVLRGSSEIKKTTVHTQEECVGKTAQAKDESHPPSIHEGVRMCTPTKLDFDNADSLEAQSPLSPYWYSQTTFGLIDAQIVEQSGGAKEGNGQQCDIVKQADLPIMPYVEEDVEPIRIISESPGIPVPSFNLGISQPSTSPNASRKGKELIIYADAPRPVRRELKIREQMKPPYVKRQVVIANNLIAEERKVHDWSLTAFGGADDFVYQSDTGQTVTRASIESLGSTMHVNEQVINGWMDVLNYEERFRSRESPKRYFFKIGILADGVTYYYMHDVDNRFTRFQRNLGLSASCNMDAVNMHNIDMAFFPLTRGSQYYYVVINLKTPSVEILDSSAREGNLDDIYDYDISILQTMPVRHLNLLPHLAAQFLQGLEQTRLKMTWCTNKDSRDSGIFLMRHMETYMGGGVRKWNSGLDKEGSSQLKQIANLRKKYTAKLLLCDHNNRKAFVESDISRLNALHKDTRAQIAERAEATRKHRLRQ